MPRSLAALLALSLLATGCGGSGSSAPTSAALPVASAGADQEVASGAAVTLDGVGSSSAGGRALSYAWSQLSGPSVALSSASAARPTFTAPAVASGAAPVALVFSLLVSDAAGTSAPSSVTVTVNPAAPQNAPPPPGTPPPAPPTPPPLTGGSGSHRFEVGTYLPLGLVIVDPAAGEPAVQGLVVVTFGSSVGPAPADAVVTLNGVPLRRLPPPSSGLFWEVDPAGAQPFVGSGGQIVLVASATDPTSGAQVQRTLVLPCPADVPVTTAPPPGSALVPGTSLHLASPADLSLNPGVAAVAQSVPTATLLGYAPATRALSPYGSPQAIAPGPLALDVPVCQGGSTGACQATGAPGYLLDLRWPGQWIVDGQTGGFCGLAKRFAFAR